MTGRGFAGRVGAAGSNTSEAEIENRLLRRQLLAARAENQRLTGMLANVQHAPMPELSADAVDELVDAVCPPMRRRRNGEP